MKEQIIANINNAGQLEKLYRADKASFKRAFKDVYQAYAEHPVATFWKERLSATTDEISWGGNKDIAFVLIASLIAGLIAKLPFLFSMREDLFYQRNAGFIVFPFIAAYFATKTGVPVKRMVFIATAMLLSLVFINALPANEKSDTLLLSCFHLVFFLWSLLGLAFTGNEPKNSDRRLAFLKYNGDVIVMTTLILIAGGIMTAITIGLFELIGFKIEKFYFENIAVFGLAAAPIVGTYLTQTNPHLVGKVSPVIARIFSPLVLVMLLVYLIAIVYSGKDPYNDREFLLIFNALLVGVMAIIFFSVAGTSKTATQAEIWVLLLLSVVTILVNCVALSAILFRISSWGITPNRAAIMGGNVLILVNQLLVAVQLFKARSNAESITGVGNVIARYLPVYAVWTIVVTFIFPFIFGFR